MSSGGWSAVETLCVVKTWTHLRVRATCAVDAGRDSRDSGCCCVVVVCCSGQQTLRLLSWELRLLLAISAGQKSMLRAHRLGTRVQTFQTTTGVCGPISAVREW